MPNIDLTPQNSTLSGVRLYRDSLDALPVSRSHTVERHETTQGTPASDLDGIGPADLVLSGSWVGADAQALADRLQAIIDDETVDTVSLQTVDDQGNAVTSKYDGDYRLAGEPSIEQPTDSEALFDYRLALTEL